MLYALIGFIVGVLLRTYQTKQVHKPFSDIRLLVLTDASGCTMTLFKWTKRQCEVRTSWKDVITDWTWDRHSLQYISPTHGMICMTGDGVTWFSPYKTLTFYITEQEKLSALLKHFSNS